MTILEFISEFPDVTSFRNNFKTNREKQGVTFKKCEGKKHYWLANKWQWQCAECRFITTWRSGTIMYHSNLSFMYGIYAFQKKGNFQFRNAMTNNS